MQSNIDVVKAWTATPGSDSAGIGAFLAEDFQNFDGEGNVTQGKAEYLGMHQMMLGSIPDMQWVPSDFREEGDMVIITGHFEGTFVNSFDLSMMGMGVIPASGKKIVWPETSVKLQVEGGKIHRMEPNGVDSGLEGFLAPLMG